MLDIVTSPSTQGVVMDHANEEGTADINEHQFPSVVTAECDTDQEGTHSSQIDKLEYEVVKEVLEQCIEQMISTINLQPNQGFSNQASQIDRQVSDVTCDDGLVQLREDFYVGSELGDLEAQASVVLDELGEMTNHVPEASEPDWLQSAGSYLQDENKAMRQRLIDYQALQLDYQTMQHVAEVNKIKIEGLEKEAGHVDDLRAQLKLAHTQLEQALQMSATIMKQNASQVDALSTMQDENQSLKLACLSHRDQIRKLEGENLALKQEQSICLNISNSAVVNQNLLRQELLSLESELGLLESSFWKERQAKQLNETIVNQVVALSEAHADLKRKIDDRTDENHEYKRTTAEQEHVIEVLENRLRELVDHKSDYTQRFRLFQARYGRGGLSLK